MLISSHGASTLGKTVRLPIIHTMSFYDGSSMLTWEAMRSTQAMLNGGRALSSISPASSPNPSNLQKLWRPYHGISFSKSPEHDKSRPISTAMVADIMLHSNAEDRYVKAASHLETTERLRSVVAAESLKAESLPEDPERNELPRSTTNFKLSEEIFRAAKNAPPGDPDSFWSHTLYRGPPQDGIEPKVKVHYCRSKHTTERTLQQYFLDKKILGFDMEWKSESHRNQGAKKNVSLIQLASEDRIGLFHIALYPKDDTDDLVAPTLKKIMEDQSITKVGVAIKADCTRLRKYLNIHAQGIFELSHLYKLVKFSSSKDFKLINKKLVSLSTQVQEHLHLPMFKGEVRSSDWSLPLQMDQILYAASDSYAGIHLYDTLEIKRKALDPTPPRPYHAEENKPIRLAEGVEIPTDEELEPDEPVSIWRIHSKVRPSYFRSAAEELEIDKLDPEFTIAVSSARMSHPVTPAKPKSADPTLRPKSPLVLIASSLADEYRQTHQKSKATPSSLRCYFLWYHNPGLSLPDIAALLRDVPLQVTTVVNYILEAIKAEKLPFVTERLREVLDVLPKEVVVWRYRTLDRGCAEEENERKKADEDGAGKK